MEPMKFSRGWHVLLFGIACLTGCGDSNPPVVEVYGTVTYAGQPLRHGKLTFTPVQSGKAIRPAVGIIGEDGTYRMAAFPQRTGAQAGEYRVSVLAYTGSLLDRTVHYLVPKRYSNPQTSGLTATVPVNADGLVQLDFHLTE